MNKLRKEIKRFIKAHNEESSKPFIWTKSAEADINVYSSGETEFVE